MGPHNSMLLTNDIENHLQRQADFSVLVDAKGRIVASSAPTSESALPKSSRCHELLGLHHSCPSAACYIRLALETGLPVTAELNHPELGVVQVRVHPLSEQSGRRELVTLHIVPVPQKLPAGLSGMDKKRLLKAYRRPSSKPTLRVVLPLPIDITSNCLT